MNIDTETLLQDLLDSLSKVDGVHPEDVPNIDLYMDQVTTFMDARLASSKRYEEDKILTKTMINNYAKNHLLPPPEKKKYSKEHMLVLIFIYYFKNILSINDIQTLLEPITKKYFHSEDGFSWIDTSSTNPLVYGYKRTNGIDSYSVYINLGKEAVRIQPDSPEFQVVLSSGWKKYGGNEEEKSGNDDCLVLQPLSGFILKD